MFKYPVAARCSRLVNIDNNMETVAKADASTRILGFKNVFNLYGDVRVLPFPDNYFDRVFCISVLEHVPEGREQGLRECIRVMKPGGLLLLSMDCIVRGDWVGDFHMREPDIRALLRVAGIEFIEARGNPIGGLLEKDGQQVQLCLILAKIYKEQG